MICGSCWRETTSESACSSCGQPALLAGRYRLERQLGQGAGGITFSGTRLTDGLAVCIKGLAYRGMSTFDAERLFHREAAVLRSIRHLQVPAYIDDFAHGSGPSFTLYLVQELVVGEDLEAEVRKRRPTTEGVVAILDELLGIVQHLHALRPAIVHRDIKPRNIMRRAADGRLVLVDFGSVKEVTQASFEAGLSLQGTLGFMAPEQLRGEATPRSDLYAIGMVGIALLTGREPTTMMNATHEVEWRGSVDVPDRLERWFVRMTAQDPAARFADAAAARSALAGATRPEPLPRSAPGPAATPPPGTARPAAAYAGVGDAATSAEVPPPSRSATLVVGSLVLVALVGLFMALSGKRSNEPKVYVEQRPPASVCGAGGCRSLSVPFKENLRFGMSLDEARAARPDIAQAPATDDGAGGTASAIEMLRSSWLPGLDPALGARRVCMSSELVGKDAHCCFDFLPESGFGRLICGTDAGLASDEIVRMIAQVERVYGLPAESARAGQQYGFEPLRDAVWRSEEAELRIGYQYAFDFAIATTDPEALTHNFANPWQRMVMTHTSAAWNAAEARVEGERRRAFEAERAEAERKRQLELDKARAERKKLGLPPDPL